MTDQTDVIQLTQTPAVTFGVPPATSASLNAFPTAVAADGTSTATITVFLKDQLGRPAPGKQVDIAQDNGHAVITGPNPSVTDSNGQIQFTATDDTNETVTFSASDVTDGELPVPGSGAVTFSGATSATCSPALPVGAAGYNVTTFATGFPANNFNFSNINFGGCPGADNPYFDPSGAVLIPDFNSGAVYQVGLGGGAVTGANIISNLGQAVGTPILKSREVAALLLRSWPSVEPIPRSPPP